MRLTTFLVTFTFLSGAFAENGEFTEMLSTVRNIEGGLYEGYLQTGKALPVSLEKIDLIREIVERKPSAGNLFNEMVLIPGAPTIQRAPDIQRSHFGWRIFAIGRTVNTENETRRSPDGQGVPGRYSVWISPDGTYCSPGWTPETEVQAVFKQIGGFDPSSQPLAFPNAERRVAADQARRITEDREFRRLYEQHQGKEKQAEKLAAPRMVDSENAVTLWVRLLGLSAGIFSLACIWYVIRSRKGDNATKQQ